jgi:hypothetical protein
VLEFFRTSGRNLLAAETAAPVRHNVALSIVGTDRTSDNGDFRAKVAQEEETMSRLGLERLPTRPMPEYLDRRPAEGKDSRARLTFLLPAPGDRREVH